MVTGCSSTVERLIWVQKVAGASPVTPIYLQQSLIEIDRLYSLVVKRGPHEFKSVVRFGLEAYLIISYRY